MMSAKELGEIEQRVVTPGYGLRQAADIGLLLKEIERLEQDNFALRDGLRGWQAAAKTATDALNLQVEWQNIIAETSAAVDEFDSSLVGSLAERVRQALARIGRMAAGLRELYRTLPPGEHLGIVTGLMHDWHPWPETETVVEVGRPRFMGIEGATFEDVWSDADAPATPKEKA